MFANIIRLGTWLTTCLYCYNAGMAEANNRPVFRNVYLGFALFSALLFVLAGWLRAREGPQRERGVALWRRTLVRLSAIASFASSKMRVRRGGVTSGHTPS